MPADDFNLLKKVWVSGQQLKISPYKGEGQSAGGHSGERPPRRSASEKPPRRTGRKAPARRSEGETLSINQDKKKKKKGPKKDETPAQRKKRLKNKKKKQDKKKVGKKTPD